MDSNDLDFEPTFGRPRIHATKSQALRIHNKAYRQRQREKGVKRKPGKSIDRSAFTNGEFIAVDGEGWNVGPIETLEIEGQVKYQSRDHQYIFLSASDGSEVYNEGKRLTTKQCLDYLCNLQSGNPGAILVAFASAYDCNNMLMFGLSIEDLRTLQRGEKAIVSLPSEKQGDTLNTYLIEYRPRKSLRVHRFAGSKVRYKGVSIKGKAGSKLDPEASFTLWDTFGFFQDRFTTVVEKWLGSDHPYLAELRTMKELRSDFDATMLARMRAYNQLECECLVLVMNKLREAVGRLGLKISRWDGAGSIAAAINSKEGVKQALSRNNPERRPDEVFQAARIAYSGGHIEVCQGGHYTGTVYHYDVNSAYPNEFRNLPDLSRGKWIHGTGTPPAGFTIVHSRWGFNPSDDYFPFYPLFYRRDDGTIIYPQHGEGWHWLPEYQCAELFVSTIPSREKTPHQLEIIEWWHFKQPDNHKPFGWVSEYYAKRQQYVAEAKRGLPPSEQWKLGAEKIIKLGLNSLYGKSCQQIGGSKDKEPTYFQLEWAGMVTAGCRAKLMRAALQNPYAIISFATDGLFSTQPLDLDAPKEKALGKWDFQTHEGITVVMPGIYWLWDGNVPSGYSRGFDKETMDDPRFIIDSWRRKETFVDVPYSRLVGLGMAVMSDAFYSVRGRWIEGTRTLRLDMLNSKRMGWSYGRKDRPNGKPARPHVGLVCTTPFNAIDPGETELQCSAPYKIDWLDDGVAESSADDRELAEAEIDSAA